MESIKALNVLKKTLLFLILYNLTFVSFSQKADSIKFASHLGGAVTITTKGISLIPNLTLGKPAAIFDFARQLNAHVNHLNRAVKETLQKTTTLIISDRVLQKAKILLKHSKCYVSEI